MAGFDLVLGKYYDDGWFNAATPEHNSPKHCSKCSSSVTIHRLEKYVLAFGKVTTKYCTIFTCEVCLHEVLDSVAVPNHPKPTATKKNLVSLFSKLPKSVQVEILTGRRMI